MSDVDNVRRDPPADWRDKLIAVLTADGITELPKVAKSKSFLVGFGKIFGWILVAGPLLGGEPDHRSTYFLLSDFQTCPLLCLRFLYGQGTCGSFDPRVDRNLLVRISAHEASRARAGASQVRESADPGPEACQAPPGVVSALVQLRQHQFVGTDMEIGCRSTSQCRRRNSIWCKCCGGMRRYWQSGGPANPRRR